MQTRSSGVLLHITSLPSAYGIGDLGPEAYAFADFLNNAGQSLWQVLPLTHTHKSHGNSPYSSVSAFAGNTLLISPERMVEDGLIPKSAVSPFADLPADRVDYDQVIVRKLQIYNAAFRAFRRRGPDAEYERFCEENKDWLDDFALFMSIRAHFKGRLWAQWPKKMRDRDPQTLELLRTRFASYIAREKFLQYVFFKQWYALKEHCARRGIRIVGDIPIYVNYDSVDVWTHPELFKLDAAKRPVYVAGVPPDYFSETGQRWGNPVYDWARLEQAGYAWWIERFRWNFKLFDVVRIDHFRGFAAFWEIPEQDGTAVNGHWTEAPGGKFFETVRAQFPSLPIIAEDLGIITPDVRELMGRFGFPGMKVLLFAFGDDFPDGLYLPHTYDPNCIVYTGTHDNNTVRGWFEHEATPQNKENLSAYFKRPVTAEDVSSVFMELAMLSPANTAIIPLQDVLGLGAGARMNRPATSDGNWQWRFLPGQLTADAAGRLLELTKASRRMLSVPVPLAP